MRAVTLCASITGALLLSPPKVGAGFVTGNDLYRFCGSPSGWEPCYRYLEAVVDMAEAAPRRELQLCLSEGVTSRQLRDIVMKALEADPASRHRSAAVLVYNAVNRAFPCPAEAKAKK